jgi:archaellin
MMLEETAIVIIAIIVTAGVLSVVPFIHPIYLTVKHFIKEKQTKENNNHHEN